jgi:hypothetical protein
MFDRLRRIALLLSTLVLVLFVIFMINQTAQIVALARDIHPVVGWVVLGSLLTLYLVLLAVPLFTYFRLPAPLEPPTVVEGPEFEKHLARLAKRLGSNARLREADLSNREAIEAAIGTLDTEATAVIKDAASQVFLSTAISQSGRLDTFVVLGANVRLVWRVARVYYQRPTLRDMWHLYANVAATAFMAGEVDDIDVSEQVQPIITSVLGSLGTAVPGLQVASSVIVNSVLGGSTNAFLTLRIGAIAQQYSAPLVAADRRKIRRLAVARAAGLLGGIVSDGAKRVVTAVVKGSRDRLLRRKPESGLTEDQQSFSERWEWLWAKEWEEAAEAGAEAGETA